MFELLIDFQQVISAEFLRIQEQMTVGLQSTHPKLGFQNDDTSVK